MAARVKPIVLGGAVILIVAAVVATILALGAPRGPDGETSPRPIAFHPQPVFDVPPERLGLAMATFNNCIIYTEQMLPPSDRAYVFESCRAQASIAAGALSDHLGIEDWLDYSFDGRTGIANIYVVEEYYAAAKEWAKQFDGALDVRQSSPRPD